VDSFEHTLHVEFCIICGSELELHTFTDQNRAKVVYKKKTKPVSNGFCEARTFFLNLFLLYVDYRVFLKENVRNPVWICRDPMSPILGT